MPPRPSSRTSWYFPRIPPSWRLAGTVAGSGGVERIAARPLDEGGDGFRLDEAGDGFRAEGPGDGFRDDESGEGFLDEEPGEGSRVGGGATRIVAVSIVGAGGESLPCSCISPVSW